MDSSQSDKAGGKARNDQEATVEMHTTAVPHSSYLKISNAKWRYTFTGVAIGVTRLEQSLLPPARSKLPAGSWMIQMLLA